MYQGLDMHHWGGVLRGGGDDAKSIASSLAVHDNVSDLGELAADGQPAADADEPRGKGDGDDESDDGGMEEVRLNEDGLGAGDFGSAGGSTGASPRPGLSKQASEVSELGAAAAAVPPAPSAGSLKVGSLGDSSSDAQPQARRQQQETEEEGWGGSSLEGESVASPDEAGAAAPWRPADAELGGAGSAAASISGAGAGGEAAVAPTPAADEQQAAAQAQIAASASDEEDLAVYTSDANGMPQEAASLAPVLRNPTLGGAAGAAAPDTGPPPVPLSSAGPAAFSVQQNGAPGRMQGGISGGASSGAAGTQLPLVRPLFPPEWERTFKGLLFMDGVDSLGRPVVVLDADAVPKSMRASALVYVRGCLEPLVNQGGYTLVCTAKHAKLPTMWLLSAYRALPRPYRKNVQWVILVRPSAWLRFLLAFSRPFVSHKAHRKVCVVETLGEVAAATGGEVTVQHFGSAFLDALAEEESGSP